jgi:hypothetical protein
MIKSMHGIGAYIGQQSPIALRNLLNTALSGVEICAAEKGIGAFGIVLSAECRAVFPYDVWSRVDENGERETSFVMRDGEILYDPSEDQYIDFNKNNKKGQYCEAWVRAVGEVPLVAIWIKKWASKPTKKAAEILARHRNVPLIVVTGQDKVWDLDIPARTWSTGKSRNDALNQQLAALIAA